MISQLYRQWTESNPWQAALFDKPSDQSLWSNWVPRRHRNAKRTRSRLTPAASRAIFALYQSFHQLWRLPQKQTLLAPLTPLLPLVSFICSGSMGLSAAPL